MLHPSEATISYVVACSERRIIIHPIDDSSFNKVVGMMKHQYET
jgi:hypothetical protein